jgi:hypothetical protein
VVTDSGCVGAKSARLNNATSRAIVPTTRTNRAKLRASLIKIGYAMRGTKALYGS